MPEHPDENPSSKLDLDSNQIERLRELMRQDPIKIPGKSNVEGDANTARHSGNTLRWPAGSESHQLRVGQSLAASIEADRQDALYRIRTSGRHIAIHEPQTSRDERSRHRHPDRCLRIGRLAL